MRARTIAAMIAVALIGGSGGLVLGTAIGSPQSPAQTPAPVTVTLPPCDDDRPGQAITGPCWLTDDDTVAVWPYPYAPAPLYVLAPSTP